MSFTRVNILFNDAHDKKITLKSAQQVVQIFGKRSLSNPLWIHWQEVVQTNPRLFSNPIRRLAYALVALGNEVHLNPMALLRIIGNTRSFLVPNELLPTRLYGPADETPIWVPRRGFEYGLIPHAIDYNLETDRILHPRRFHGQVRSVGRRSTRRTLTKARVSLTGLYSDGVTPQSITMRSRYPFSVEPELPEKEVEFDSVESHQNSVIYHGLVAECDGLHLAVGTGPISSSTDVPWPTLLRTSKNRNHLETPGVLQAQRYEGSSIAFVGSSKSWYHVIIESGNRIFLLQQHLGELCPIVVTSDMPQQLMRVVKILTGHEPVIVPVFTSLSIPILYTVSESPSKLADHTSTSDAALDWIRSRLLSGHVEGLCDLKVLIIRRDGLQRKLQNATALRKLVIEFGFVVIDPEDLKLEEQINLFARTKVLIAESGAALTNVMFMSPGSIVLELHPPLDLPGFWERFSQRFGLIHYTVVGQFRLIGWSGVARDNWILDLEKVKAIINAIS